MSADSSAATAPVAATPTAAESVPSTGGEESFDPAAVEGGDDYADLEELRAKVAAMEEEQAEEAKRMNELSGMAPSNPAGSSSGGGAGGVTAEQQTDIDFRSVHVAQVDYSVTEQELKTLFEACGAVNRVTILKDRYSGQPKGYAYIEFKDVGSVENALILNDTEFKNRTLKVAPKRTNLPGFNRGRGGRGRGRGGRGGFGGGYDEGAGAGGYGPIRGRGRGRGRGAPRGGYHPYQYQY